MRLIKINLNQILSLNFFNNKFTEINLLKNQIIYDNSDFSLVELIAKQVIVELENWWKDKIDDFEVEQDNTNEFEILIKTDDLKKSSVYRENS